MKKLAKIFYWTLCILYAFKLSTYLKALIDGESIPYYRWFLTIFFLGFFLFNAMKYGEEER